MPDYFIDSHCHLFNIEDIPLYATIANVKNLPNPLLAAGALISAHRSVLNKRSLFLDFFDNRRKENAQNLVNEIQEAAKFHPVVKGRKIILTPLVMDFDKIGDKEHYSHENVFYQTRRLREEVIEAGLDNKALILIFAGLDLRKLDGNVDVQAFLNGYFREAGGLKPISERKNPAELSNGDIVGIKLYPPIGFNPFSDTSANEIDPARKTFYEYCIQKRLPITVHCQSGSYHGFDVNKKIINKNAHPTNWERVMKAIDGDKLKINFAHFGGEEELRATVLPVPSQTELGDFRPLKKFKKGSWVLSILTMLKTYEQTYADISAFDYSNKAAVMALAWLFVLDEVGDLDGRLGIGPSPCKLKDKLIWGSDMPMIYGKPKGLLKETGHVEVYGAYLESFTKAMQIAKIKARPFPNPAKYHPDNIPDPVDLIDRLTNKNPYKFLFG